MLADRQETSPANAGLLPRVNEGTRTPDPPDHKMPSALALRKWPLCRVFLAQSIVADPNSLSCKAIRAREYGVRIVAEGILADDRGGSPLRRSTRRAVPRLSDTSGDAPTFIRHPSHSNAPMRPAREPATVRRVSRTFESRS